MYSKLLIYPKNNKNYKNGRNNRGINFKWAKKNIKRRFFFNKGASIVQVAIIIKNWSKIKWRLISSCECLTILHYHDSKKC